LRYCASCVLTLVLWAVWLLLGAVIAIQCYIGIVKDLPVPAFILRHIEAGLAAENVTVRFGAAHFDPTGRLLLENVQVHVRGFEEPLFSSRLVYAHKSIWSVLAGRPVPDEVRFEGATLQLPAIFSPSGTTEPLLREMAGRVRFDSGECHIDQLAFHVGSMSVSVSGIVTQPRSVHGKPLETQAIVGRFLQYGRQIALFLPQLQAADRPALNIEASARPQGGTNLAFMFTADAVRAPAGLAVEIGPLFVSGHWAWDGVRPHAMRLHVAAQSVNGPNALTAANVRGTLMLEPPELEFATVAWVEARLAAGNVHALGEDWVLPVVTGSYSLRDGAAQFRAAMRSHDELLVSTGEASTHDRTARIDLDGLVPPALVTGLLTRYGPKLEPYFRFGDPVDLQARVTVAAGWKFAGLATRVHGGRLDSHGVQITSARGRIDVDSGLNFLAYDAELVAGENVARGSYWMNFHTFDYRMLLAGRLRPADITGWFRGDWWPNFWKNFSFPAVPPQADVDVQGCWKDPSRTSYFGSTDATKPVVLGAEFDHARTRVFVRPQFAHVLDLAVERAGGTQRASGWFQRTGGAPGQPDNSSSYDYDLAGNLDLAAYEAMGGATAAKLLASWHFDQPPQLHAVGHTDLSDGKAVSTAHFTGDAKGGLQYSGFPLEGLSVDGGVQGDDYRLDRVDFQFAGGRGSAKATLGGPADARHLALETSLKDADLVRTIRAFEDFEANRTGTKSTSMAGSKFIKRASGGKLELAFNAQGNPADVASLRGSGTAQLTGGELGEIHLFGLLSQVMSAVALNFTSLKLDAARTSFQLADGRVHFPDVRITGPSAMIEAKGDYLFASKSLDFTAKLKPYEESHNPLTAVVGIVINPLTSIFELKLTGPLAKPSWSIVLGQGPKPEAPAGGTGGIPAPVIVPAAPAAAGPATSPASPADPPKKPAPAAVDSGGK
jgi:hypothetical protein